MNQPEQITRDHIEAKLREIRGGVDEVTTASKEYLLIAGAVGVLAIVAVAYGLGRRRGRKRATVVEIRRV